MLVEIDPTRMASRGVTVADLRGALQSANLGLPVGELLAGNRAVAVESGPFLKDARDVGELVVGVRGGKPVFLQDVATVATGRCPPRATSGTASAARTAASIPAVTISVTKKPGENAIDVADAVMQRVDALRNTVIPHDVEVVETRNYGATANDKAIKLIQKLLFATASVVALVFVALGRREAAIVGTAVILTLTVTLFASWAWGFTLNRVSLFALIFSIGILVDDAIVVVENIHRHQQLYPGKPLAQIIPGAVDEVGGPTILATLTVIAALLPMAFVSGLMGPYMSPIPINASMGMLLSLAIAFVVTPWLARLWMKGAAGRMPPATASRHGLSARLAPLFERIFPPLLDDAIAAGATARLLAAGVAVLIALSLLLPVLGLVQLKMLPFDNKSEFQVVVDMPAGTPVERTAAVLHELGAHLATVPEVTRLPGLCRHGRADQLQRPGAPVLPAQRRRGRRHPGQPGRQAPPQRAEPRHRHARAAGAADDRPALRRQRQGRRGAAGPAGAVAASWPRSTAPRPKAAARSPRRCAACSRKTEGVVDVDDSSIADAPRTLLLVDRRKAAMLGVSQQEIVSHAARRPGRRGHSLPARRRASTRPRRRCSCRPKRTATSTRCCS